MKRSDTKLCAWCPFEDQIIQHYPELRALFIEKRRQHGKKR